MNNRATYEISIAEKLEHMQVPDMQDAIWSRIEAQLDIDMPTDPDNSGGHTDTDWRNLFGNAGPFIFIVVIVSVLFFQAHKKNQTIPTKQETIHQELINNDNQQTGKSPPIETIKPGYSPATKNTSPAPTGKDNLPDNIIKTPAGDEPLTIPQLANEDAVSPPLQLPPDKADIIIDKTLITDPATKKPRGVQGIKDGDYRLVPKPDSTKPRKN